MKIKEYDLVMCGAFKVCALSKPPCPQEIH